MLLKSKSTMGSTYWRVPFMICVNALLATSIAYAEPARLDFADVQDFDDFVEAGGRNVYVYSTQPGVGDEPGRVDANVGSEATTLYYRNPVDLNQGALEISYCFLARSYSRGSASRVAIGLWDNVEDNFVGRSHFQLRLIKGGAAEHARLEVRNAEDDEVAREIQLQDDHWYRLSAKVEHVGSGRFEVAGKLEHLGDDGQSPANQAVAEARGIYANERLIEESRVKPMFVGVLLQSEAGGATALDEFEVAGDALAAEPRLSEQEHASADAR